MYQNINYQIPGIRKCTSYLNIRMATIKYQRYYTPIYIRLSITSIKDQVIYRSMYRYIRILAIKYQIIFIHSLYQDVNCRTSGTTYQIASGNAALCRDYDTMHCNMACSILTNVLPAGCMF